jgi:hypothetical protein
MVRLGVELHKNQITLFWLYLYRFLMLFTDHCVLLFPLPFYVSNGFSRITYMSGYDMYPSFIIRVFYSAKSFFLPYSFVGYYQMINSNCMDYIG